MDLFKGKGHKVFTAAYLKLWADLIQQSYEQEIVLIDPLLDKVCHLSTGLSRQVTSLLMTNKINEILQSIPYCFSQVFSLRKFLQIESIPGLLTKCLRLVYPNAVQM